MADHNNCAGVITEVFADDFLGFGVEVVGGLVENDEVGALEEDFTERDTGFFAWGEDGNLFINIVARKEEVREGGAEFGISKIVTLDVFEDGTAFVEKFELLGVVGDSGVMTEDDRTVSWGQFTNNEFEQSRFADAVFANNEELFATSE